VSSLPKAPDRRRPFRRLDNDAFHPARALDGDGAAVGCPIQKDIGDIEAVLDRFVKDSKETVLGKTITTAIEVVRTILDPTRLVDLLRDEIAKKTGKTVADLLVAPLTALAVAFKTLLGPVAAIVNAVIGAVETAVDSFLKTLGRPVLLRANRVLPQWMPVTAGQSNAVVDRPQVIEVEGICTRSFGNPVDMPFTNWRTWFGWNVQLALEPEYARALSPAGDPPNTSGMAGSERSIIQPGTFEVQWDAGALFGAGERSAFDRNVADLDTPKVDGPMTIAAARGSAIENGGTDLDTAFVWPMAGLFVWAAGRHVYDCSRVTHKANSDPDKADVEATPPRMAAMMHPARALATARFQAFQFPDNGTFFVPAVEFMFIACKRGGYIDHAQLADEDYTFVIDLPPGPPAPSPFPIANTDKVPHNTIVLRPRLLKNLRFLQRIDSAGFDPILELLPPPAAGQAPRQVKLTVPAGALNGTTAYGFRLALGWHDPARELARQVLLCELDLKSLRMRLTQRDDPGQKLRDKFKKEEGDLTDRINKELEKVKINVPIIGDVHPMQIPGIGALMRQAVAAALNAVIGALVKLIPGEGEEEWLFRVGVNGLWVSFFFHPSKGETKTFNANELVFRFALAKGDELLFAAHGTEFDPVGDIMHAAREKRVLKLRSGAVATWPRICKPASPQERDELLFTLMRSLMFDTTEGVGKMSFGFDNQPLGLVDPDVGGNRGPSQQHNPMVAGEPFEQPLRAQRLARFARAIAPEMVLVEDTVDAPVTRFPIKPDYDLRYELTVKPQIADAPPAA
jgi:hypothetical protein